MSIHDKQYVIRGRRYRLSRQFSAKQVLSENRVTFVDLEDPMGGVVEVGRDALPKEAIADARQECGISEGAPANPMSAAKRAILNYMEACEGLTPDEDGGYGQRSLHGLDTMDEEGWEAAKQFMESMNSGMDHLVPQLISKDAERARKLVDHIAPMVMAMIVEDARDSGVTDYDMATLRMNGDFAKLAYNATRHFVGAPPQEEED